MVGEWGFTRRNIKGLNYVKEKIEDLRSLLNEAYKEGVSLNDGKMLRLSQRLDKLLADHYKSSLTHPYRVNKRVALHLFMYIHIEKI